MQKSGITAERWPGILCVARQPVGLNTMVIAEGCGVTIEIRLFPGACVWRVRVACRVFCVHNDWGWAVLRKIGLTALIQAIITNLFFLFFWSVNTNHTHPWNSNKKSIDVCHKVAAQSYDKT